jgi:hypothetical protein
VTELERLERVRDFILAQQARHGFLKRADLDELAEVKLAIERYQQAQADHDDRN